jgi:hypothetical protein
MNVLSTGIVRKMVTALEAPVTYKLPIGDEQVPMNPLIGQHVRLRNTGEIRCLACDRKTRKSFAQGHCYPCFRRLARCDGCIVRPETCHYAAGTCREPGWGEAHCLIPHTVYLANTGAIKVGITRGGNEPIRWVDQGASQALPIWTVPDRLSSGQVEMALKAYVSDRTNWRKMLSGVPEDRDLEGARDEILAAHADGGCAPFRGHAVDGVAVTRIGYPVDTYPDKVRSIDLDKAGAIEGTLTGIKGQYLIFDSGVVNVRKYGGYVLELSAA